MKEDTKNTNYTKLICKNLIPKKILLSLLVEVKAIVKAKSLVVNPGYQVYQIRSKNWYQIL